MKIIDLLNKIANGEIPKRIFYDDRTWVYDEKFEDYITGDDSRIDWRYTVLEYINDEVEIIEDKKIEKLETYDIDGDIFFDDCCFKYIPIDKKKLNHNEMVLVEKINKLIDKLNSMEE